MYSLNKKPLRAENIVLSDAEKQLVTALIPIIHKWWDRPKYKEEPNSLPGYIFHMAQSSFENSADILEQLELASPSPIHPNYIKVVPKSNIGMKIRFEKVVGNYWIFDFLCVFLDHGYHYNTYSRLPVRRNQVFKAANADQELAFDALVNCGYAKITRQAYQWTDKMAPIMLAHGLWDKDDVNFNQVDNDSVKNWLSQIEREGLDKLPSWVYGGYSGQSTGKLMGLTFCILRHWSGVHWSGVHWLDIAVDKPVLSFDNAAALAHEVLLKYQHGGDRKNHKWLSV